jgi:hypothetical protein
MGTEDRGDRACVEYLAHVLLFSDPSGREHRHFHRRPNALDQLEQRRRAADVPAGLNALSYHRVGTRRLSSSCLLDRTALMDPRCSGEPTWLTPKGDDHVSVGHRLNVPWPEKVQNEIDRDRSARQLASGGQLLSDPSASATDRPKPAGLRYRRR